MPPYLYSGCSASPSSLPPLTRFQHEPTQTKCQVPDESIWQRTSTSRSVVQSVQFLRWSGVGVGAAAAAVGVGGDGLAEGAVLVIDVSGVFLLCFALEI